jgi:hypothetical protein
MLGLWVYLNAEVGEEIATDPRKYIVRNECEIYERNIISYKKYTLDGLSYDI